MTRRLSFVAALVAVAGAVVSWRLAALPAPAPIEFAAIPGQVTVGYHVHSRRSDGTGTVEDIAAAAQAAGLDAVILTDHGDGTRDPDRPRRIDGVLVVEAVELSTWAGHYVALGMRAAPYRLGGTPASVVDDVARLGGVGLVAHPTSPKAELRWRDWDAGFDGVEWLNADSEWRDRPSRLWDALVTYPWAPSRTIAALLDRPIESLAEWDRHAARRPVAGLAALDAHARLGLRGVGEPYDGAVALNAPSYGAMFRTFTNVVSVDPASWGRDAELDAKLVIEAIRAGRTYSVVTAWGALRLRRFIARAGTAAAASGEHLAAAGPVTFEVESDAPSDATTVVVCDGRPREEARGAVLQWTTVAPVGACRVEVRRAGGDHRTPWLVSNPIYVRDQLTAPTVAAQADPQVTIPLAGSGLATSWTAETSPGSAMTVAPSDRRVALTWTLTDAPAAFAAASLSTPPGLAGFDRLIVRATADRPMRVWVQLRTPEDGGRRWGMSMFLDQTPRQVTLPFDHFLALDGTSSLRVPLASVSAALVVADGVHGRPGERGTVTFDEWWLAR